jgi:hypothetical protein
MNDWDNFGYDSDEACIICGMKPTKLEPRFCYSVCENHYKIKPVDVKK